MKLLRNFLAFPIAFLFLFSQTVTLCSQSGGAPEYKPTDPIPMDPAIITGKLENGLTYFIRKNSEPENRVELRLVVNAGSILENEKQLGLAHFCEHMAFNGTANFKKSELVDYLESIGTKFGAHLNAYTSFDETVYMLQIPTDDSVILDKGFRVLLDWAGGLSFDPEEVEKERGVVIEEWRLGQGAQMRMFKKLFPVLFGGSLYAERLPIGTKEILETFDHEVLKKFYRDWYRPELMAVIAVGDFKDAEAIRKRIETDFGKLTNPDDAPARVVTNIPDSRELKAGVATDKETPMTLVMLQYNHDVNVNKTIADYRTDLTRNLVTEMLNSRLAELAEKGDPPYIFAQSNYGGMVRTKTAWATFCMAQQDKVLAAAETLVRENERAKRHGFLESELERAKKSLLRSAQQEFKEQNQTESGNFASEYVSLYLEKEPVPGSQAHLEICNQLLPGIGLEEVNQLIRAMVRDENNSLIVMATDREGVSVPDSAEMPKIYKQVMESEIPPYTEVVDDAPLITTLPKPGKVKTIKGYDKPGAVEWVLENGAKVIIKPTDFKNDEIILRASSPGGFSRTPRSKVISARHAAGIVVSSGIGKFDETTLQKKLADKVVNVNPWIDETHEGFSGNCSPEDFETMLQLIHLYCTKPRQDQEAFESYLSKTKGMLETSTNSPEYHYRRAIVNTGGANDIRRRMLEVEDMDSIRLNDAYQFFYDRFSDVSDFTFVLTGNVDTAKAKSLIETYLGGIESFQRIESWKDFGIRPDSGIVDTVVRKGVEPKSMVSITFHGDLRWNSRRIYAMKAAASVLRIMLREALREEMGGTYFVISEANPDLFPDTTFEFTVGFGCAPENVDTMVKETFRMIDELVKEGPSMKNFQKVQETLKRSWETDQKENVFWARQLLNCTRTGADPNRIEEEQLQYERLIDKDIQHAAKEFLNRKQYYKVVLMPEL